MSVQKELERRLSLIKSEPNGLVRETMIDNLLIDLPELSAPNTGKGDEQIKEMAERFATTCFSKDSFRWEKVVQYYTQGINDWIAKKIFENLAEQEDKPPFSMPIPAQERFPLTQPSAPNTGKGDDDIEGMKDALSTIETGYRTNEFESGFREGWKERGYASAPNTGKGGVWVKASERFPDNPNEKIFRIKGKAGKYIITEDFFPEYLVFNGEEIEYFRLEYLDETSSPISVGANPEQGIEAVEALKKAVEVIKQWHNADDVWDIYYNHAPEMKPIREALLNYKP